MQQDIDPMTAEGDTSGIPGCQGQPPCSKIRVDFDVLGSGAERVTVQNRDYREFRVRGNFSSYTVRIHCNDPLD